MDFGMDRHSVFSFQPSLSLPDPYRIIISKFYEFYNLSIKPPPPSCSPNPRFTITPIPSPSQDLQEIVCLRGWQIRHASQRVWMLLL